MIRPPPISTRPDTLCPSTTLFRSKSLPTPRPAIFWRWTYRAQAAERKTWSRPYWTQVSSSDRVDTPRRGSATGLYELPPRFRLPRLNAFAQPFRSEEHTSELQSLMRISYAVFCLNKKKQHTH